MSKSIRVNSFKNFCNSNTISINSKISQKEIKKQKKQELKTNSLKNGISDTDFEKIMYEEKLIDKKLNINNKYFLPDSNIISEKVKEIINNEIIGENLVKYLELLDEKVNGLDLLNGILNKYEEPNDISWLNMDMFGSGLKSLLENNITDQVKYLLTIQNYCKNKEFIKIQYKNSKTYQIKILFQLSFTNEIIDESSYWEWYEYLEQLEDMDENTKNIIFVQTTEFFIILKTIFNDEDEDEENEDNLNQKNKINNKKEFEEEFEKDNTVEEFKKDKTIEDLDEIPEEQDYNLDETNIKNINKNKNKNKKK